MSKSMEKPSGDSEAYSKYLYNELKQRADASSGRMNELKRDRMHYPMGHFNKLSHDINNTIRVLEDLAKEDKVKLDKLHANAKSEALELNKKYDELLKNAKDALRDLQKFRQSELGTDWKKITVTSDPFSKPDESGSFTKLKMEDAGEDGK